MYTFKEYVRREEIFGDLLGKLGGNTQLAHKALGGMSNNLRHKYNNIVRRRVRNKIASQSRKINCRKRKGK